VDHQLRPESGAEIRRVRGWLSARGIRHEVVAWSQAKPVSGIQNAARAARYSLLGEWCREHGCPHLLTAHQREDQVETFLIRRRAGSGPEGLAGISAIREFADCRILRPLLGVPKARLSGLLEAERQPFISDPSNSNPIFERSRLRGDGTIPVGADFAALCDEIRTLGCERLAQERKRATLLARAVSLHPGGFAVIDPGLVLEAPHDTAERVLAAVAATIGGGIYPARRRVVERLRESFARGKGQTLGGCRFVAWRGRFLVLRELAPAAPPVQLIPGAGLLWDGRFEVGLPGTADRPVVIGHLGRAGATELRRFASGLSRSGLPRLLHPILPAGWDEDGIVVVPQLGYVRPGKVAVPQFSFRPVNPVTRAGFTVV
jgi:tRNA(Ile)-lysidine synthase